MSLPSDTAGPEGRRIYLGNLLYTVKPTEIETMLADQGVGQVQKIHISIDPVTARNPGYCFVDFVNREDAQTALSSITGSIRGRAVRVGPYEAKKERTNPRPRWKSDQDPTFQRWGDWKGQRDSARDDDAGAGVPLGKIDARGTEHGPYGATDHFDDMVKTDPSGRRLYVGGLGKMIDQRHNDNEISDIFTSAGFQPRYISKRITPHEVTAAKPGNHHYCFVDFETPEEASAAMAATNGTSLPQYGGRLRVSIANPIPPKLTRRATGADDGAPLGNDNRRDWRSGDRGTTGRSGGDASGRGGYPSSSRTDAAGGSAPRSQRGFTSENWRRRDDAA